MGIIPIVWNISDFLPLDLTFTFKPNLFAMKYRFAGLVGLLYTLLFGADVFAQNVQPDIWLKPDSLVGSNLLFSQHGEKRSPLQLDTSATYAAGTLNGNPVVLLQGTANTFKLPVHWLKGRHLQVLVAYQPDTSQTAHGLYQFYADTNLVLGVTNNDVLQRNTRLNYSDTLIGHGVVSSVKVFTMHPIPSSPDRFLHIGKSDSIFLKGKMGEVIVFNRKTHTPVIPYYETYLAIKYGITLKDGNYTTLTDTLWSKTANAAYHFDVAGLGTDTLSGLAQKTAESSAGDVVAMGLDAALSNPHADPLQQGSYVIWGRNNRMWYDLTEEAITFDSSLFRLNREWKVQAYGAFDAAQARFYIRFNARQYAGLNNPLLLLRKNELDAGSYHAADSTDTTGMVYYRNVRWDTDSSGSDYFSFVFPFSGRQTNALGSGTNTIVNASNSPLVNAPQQAGEPTAQTVSNQLNEADLRVFPVPSNGSVSSRITVPSGENTRLEIYNYMGAKVDAYELQGSNAYLLHHHNLSQGQYMFVLLSAGNRIVRQVLITK